MLPKSSVGLLTKAKRAFMRSAGNHADSMWKLFPTTPALTVPDHIIRPPYAAGDVPSIKSRVIEYKTPEQVATMREACEFASYIREFAGKQVEVGITTDEIDKRLHAECVRLGIYPSPLGYCGFPKSVCTSVNNVVCHGIPDLRPLEDGDILNIDVTVYHAGYHGDCSAMFTVGTPSAADQELIATTKEALDSAIAICGPGVPLTAIGDTVQRIADAKGFAVVESFTGHGIGATMHMAPNIFHHRNSQPGVMAPGMVFTIEPILNASPRAGVLQMRDGWTIVTTDGARSAQFEQTLVITDSGADIMTRHAHCPERFV